MCWTVQTCFRSSKLLTNFCHIWLFPNGQKHKWKRRVVQDVERFGSAPIPSTRPIDPDAILITGKPILLKSTMAKYFSLKHLQPNWLTLNSASTWKNIEMKISWKPQQYLKIMRIFEISWTEFIMKMPSFSKTTKRTNAERFY